MENLTGMREQAKKCVSKSQVIPSAGRKAAGLKKGVLFPQEAESRGNMYRFLSTVYLRPPTKDLVRHIADMEFLDEVSSLFGEVAVADLKEFAATVTIADSGKRLASLKQEYMDLFAVPTGRYTTPFEDVHWGKTVDGKQNRGPLMGERAIAVRRIYRGAGAEMDRENKELPTHIGVELSFMNFLCEREVEALQNEEGGGMNDEEKRKNTEFTLYRKLQLSFLQEHLNLWFPQLSQSIQANAKSELYRGLALITEEFLRWDTTSLLTQSPVEKHMRAQKTSMQPQTG